MNYLYCVRCNNNTEYRNNINCAKELSKESLLCKHAKLAVSRRTYFNTTIKL